MRLSWSARVILGILRNIDSKLVYRIGLEEIICCVFLVNTVEGDSFNFAHVAVL